MGSLLYWKPASPVDFITDCLAAYKQNPKESFKSCFDSVAKRLDLNEEEEEITFGGP